MNITATQIKNTAKLTALVSFIIGTFLVLLFALFRTCDTLIVIGIYYVAIAIAVNLIVFVSVLISVLYFWNLRHQLFITCGVLLLNIPIAIAYFFIVIYLSDL